MWTSIAITWLICLLPPIRTEDTDLVCKDSPSCQWDVAGWYSTFGVTANQSEVHSVLDGMNISFIKPKFSNETNHDLLLVFTSTDKEIIKHNKSIIMVMTDKGENYYSQYFSCWPSTLSPDEGHRDIWTDRRWQIVDRNGARVYINCSFVDSNNWFDYNSTLSFKSDGNLTADLVSLTLQDFSTQSFHSTSWFGPDMKTNFLSLHWDEPNSVKPYIQLPNVKSNILCLGMEVYSSIETESKVLEISGQYQHQTVHVLGNVDELKVGWQEKHIFLEVPVEIKSPMKLSISKTSSDEVQIRRIFSCMDNGPQVQFLPLNDANESSYTSFNKTNIALGSGILVFISLTCLGLYVLYKKRSTQSYHRAW